MRQSFKYMKISVGGIHGEDVTTHWLPLELDLGNWRLLTSSSLWSICFTYYSCTSSHSSVQPSESRVLRPFELYTWLNPAKANIHTFKTDGWVQRSTHFADAQSKPHMWVPWLVKTATYQSGVFYFFLWFLLALLHVWGASSNFTCGTPNVVNLQSHLLIEIFSLFCFVLFFSLMLQVVSFQYI